jgi:hypothetical protein
MFAHGFNGGVTENPLCALVLGRYYPLQRLTDDGIVRGLNN